MSSPSRHTLLLAALLFPSLAVRAAETSPSGPERFEKEIAAFEAKDRQSPPPKGGILFLGSSSIRLWKTLAEDFPGYPVINRGFGGSHISDSVHFVDRLVFPYEPKQIIFYAGGNDLNAKKTPETVIADFKTFVEKVRARLPETEICYISIAGNPARWAQVEKVKQVNQTIEQWIGSQPNMKFINVFPAMLGPDGLPKPDIFVEDRLHMNANGYAIWKGIVGPFLKK